MLIAIIILVVALIVLLVLRERDAQQLERILAAAAEERRSLLDRIQHPQRFQAPPVERERPEMPRDSAELAQIGRIVPDGVKVGTSGSAE